MRQEGKAEEYVIRADKKLSSWITGASKWEDAAELYTKAANLFKMEKKWDNAASAYSKASECHIKLQSKYEAASSYVQAAGCHKKSNSSEAMLCLRQAIEFYLDDGKFGTAGKYQKELAELYESNVDVDNALAAYQLAADYYEAEGSTNSTHDCLLKVALLSAQLERYDRAIELYEQIAAGSVDTLRKWSVKDYLLRAGLCHLAKQDIVATDRALERYQDMSASFSSERECKFLQDILEAVKNYDVPKFTAIVGEYDSITRLDAWKTSILLKVKKSLDGEGELI